MPSEAVWSHLEPHGVIWDHLQHASINHQVLRQLVLRLANHGSGELLTQYMMSWLSIYSVTSGLTPDRLFVGLLDTTRDDETRRACVYVYAFP